MGSGLANRLRLLNCCRLLDRSISQPVDAPFFQTLSLTHPSLARDSKHARTHSQAHARGLRRGGRPDPHGLGAGPGRAVRPGVGPPSPAYRHGRKSRERQRQPSAGSDVHAGRAEHRAGLGERGGRAGDGPALGPGAGGGRDARAAAWLQAESPGARVVGGDSRAGWPRVCAPGGGSGGCRGLGGAGDAGPGGGGGGQGVLVLDVLWGRFVYSMQAIN